MRHTVHVTVTMSVEIDTEELKREFGKSNKKMILEIAKQIATLDSAFDSKAVIADTWNEEKPKARKGISSY